MPVRARIVTGMPSVITGTSLFVSGIVTPGHDTMNGTHTLPSGAEPMGLP